MRKKAASRPPRGAISEIDAARVRSVSALERLLAYAEGEALTLHERGSATWLRMARVLLLCRTCASGSIDRLGYLPSASALAGVLEYAWLDAVDLRRRGVAALIRMAISTLGISQAVPSEGVREIRGPRDSADDAQQGD
jgi:hypothetical protein